MRCRTVGSSFSNLGYVVSVCTEGLLGEFVSRHDRMVTDWRVREKGRKRKPFDLVSIVVEGL